MAGPQDAAAASRDQLRAGHADREQVIEALKDAFVDGRLNRDELGVRAGRALTSRTYADLADLTADIRARPAAAKPAGEPAVRPARTLATAARRAGTCVLVPLALVGVIALTNAENLAGLAFLCGVAAAIAASGFLGYGVIDAWQQWRSRGQLPPRPRRQGTRPIPDTM
jgi:hypothetical protein